MKSFIPFILTAATYSLGATSSINEFDELSLRYIKFSPQHIEKLPLAAIERLRAAAPLPRPLTAESLNEVRASLSDISTLTGSTISDEAIEQLQGRFQRKLWGPGYIDVTDSVSAGFDDSTRSQTPFVAPITAPKYPTPDPSAHPELKPMLEMVNSTELRDYVTHLSTAYRTRYYRHPNARGESAVLLSSSAVVLSRRFESFQSLPIGLKLENKFNQPNIVGRIEAKSGSSSAPIIILGAHLDSTSQLPWVAPGADDDASGLSVVMAIMRILKANDYQGSYAIEAHAYAGEEGGLLGSDALARAYKDQGKEIRGMIEFEMVGYQPSTSSNAGKSSTITVLADPVPSMTSHMIKVVEAYVPTAELRSVNCGRPLFVFQRRIPRCLPRIVWPERQVLEPQLVGIPNFSILLTANGTYSHAMSDTVDKLDFEKMTDFVPGRSIHDPRDSNVCDRSFLFGLHRHHRAKHDARQVAGFAPASKHHTLAPAVQYPCALASGFDDLSVRSIQFSSGHVERLPIAAIERLRSAAPLPRPLAPESFVAARKSLADISILTASVISDEAIDRLQGHFQRNVWGPGYVDITDSLEDSSKRSLAPRADTPVYPTPDPSAHPELEPMLTMVNSSELRSYVTQLSTKYKTRYYLSLNANQSAEWIGSQLASWLGKAQTQFSDNAFPQSNVIGRIEAKSGDPNAPIIILGAHLDSTSQTPALLAPGADDDASGVAVTMSIMRILKTNNYQGTHAIEAHAYAGEEGGLLGSQNLAKQYKAQNKTIRGMLNFEMVGKYDLRAPRRPIQTNTPFDRIPTRYFNQRRKIQHNHHSFRPCSANELSIVPNIKALNLSLPWSSMAAAITTRSTTQGIQSFVSLRMGRRILN
ncbi:peptidase family m28 domain-containing protein [Rhizoctonia solani AG-1 IA]|uniref:Peptide hydrolase n=1 Tax=Thanatephorus cucumeris (strain AG1-IA) TaxID=983506 RepID=L8X0L6_THACA|nr:peptidase family m28 domain-containing protein [Rhizoctonia solani AG-1 IA]